MAWVDWKVNMGKLCNALQFVSNVEIFSFFFPLYELHLPLHKNGNIIFPKYNCAHFHVMGCIQYGVLVTVEPSHWVQMPALWKKVQFSFIKKNGKIRIGAVYAWTLNNHFILVSLNRPYASHLVRVEMVIFSCLPYQNISRVHRSRHWHVHFIQYFVLFCISFVLQFFNVTSHTISSTFSSLSDIIAHVYYHHIFVVVLLRSYLCKMPMNAQVVFLWFVVVSDFYIKFANASGVGYNWL